MARGTSWPDIRRHSRLAPHNDPDVLPSIPDESLIVSAVQSNDAVAQFFITMTIVTARAITDQTLGAWVIKCNPHKTDLAPMVDDGRAQEHWCVANNYRTRLMAPGQPVLFWVSGHPRRGIWGSGTLTGTPVPGPQWKVATDIVLFGAPILASSIQSISALSTLEVFRSPQQSNPSWIDASAWAVIRLMLPLE